MKLLYFVEHLHGVRELNLKPSENLPVVIPLDFAFLLQGTRRGWTWYSLNVFGFEIAQSPYLSCREDIA